MPDECVDLQEKSIRSVCIKQKLEAPVRSDESDGRIR